MADLSMIKVEKKDGSQESYIREKLVGGMVKSGATQEQADLIAAQIEEWMPTVAASGVIKTSDLRAKLLELLKAVNPQAGDAFAAYQKPAEAAMPVGVTDMAVGGMPPVSAPMEPLTEPVPSAIDEVTPTIPEPIPDVAATAPVSADPSADVPPAVSPTVAPMASVPPVGTPPVAM
jgi:hypothetical protein